jgi:hypothetical protein
MSSRVIDDEEATAVHSAIWLASEVIADLPLIQLASDLLSRLQIFWCAALASVRASLREGHLGSPSLQ